MIRRKTVSRSGIEKCGDVTRCICKAKCGETHNGTCSDQNVLSVTGFIITCYEHQDANYEKYSDRIAINQEALDRYFRDKAQS